MTTPFKIPSIVGGEPQPRRTVEAAALFGGSVLSGVWKAEHSGNTYFPVRNSVPTRPYLVGSIDKSSGSFAAVYHVKRTLPSVGAYDYGLNVSWLTFGRVYLYPGLLLQDGNLLNFGNVIADKDLNAYVWNTLRGVRAEAQVGTFSVPEGMQFVSPSVPFVTISFGLTTLVIRALAEGPPTVEGVFSLSFDTYQDRELELAGSRVGSVDAAPEVPIIESLEFITNIAESVDGTEQRISMRPVPRQILQYRYVLFGQDRRKLENILFSKLGGSFLVPLWFESAELAEAAPSGQNFVKVDTAEHSDFRVGSNVFLVRDGASSETLIVQSVATDTITFTGVLANDYPVGSTRVMPARTCVVLDIVQSQHYNVNVLDVTLIFRVVDNDVDHADVSAWPSYNGKVYLNDPNVTDGSMQESFEARRMVIDGNFGVFQTSPVWRSSKRTFSKGFFTRSREQLWNLRQLFHHLKGRQTSFYIPGWFDDLVVTQTLLQISNSMTVENAGWSLFALSAPGRSLVRVTLNNGTEITRTITDGAEISALEEELTVDTTWPTNIEPDEIKRVDFIYLARFDSDLITIEHQNNLGYARSTVPVTQVFD